MPYVPTGNTNTATIMVAEKASDIIKSTLDCHAVDYRDKHTNNNRDPWAEDDPLYRPEIDSENHRDSWTQDTPLLKPEIVYEKQKDSWTQEQDTPLLKPEIDSEKHKDSWAQDNPLFESEKHRDPWDQDDSLFNQATDSNKPWTRGESLLQTRSDPEDILAEVD